jgi:hypothetical protein
VSVQFTPMAKTATRAVRTARRDVDLVAEVLRTAWAAQDLNL